MVRLYPMEEGHSALFGYLHPGTPIEAYADGTPISDEEKRDLAEGSGLLYIADEPEASLSEKPVKAKAKPEPPALTTQIEPEAEPTAP